MSHVNELFRQVWLRPHDDQLRLVLADALLAIGDPRGELIHLQYRSHGEHAVRIMRLLQENGLTWLGALRGAVVPIAYERGFLANCVLVNEGIGFGVDEWSTVHTIEVSVDDASVIGQPVMRSLRRVTNLEPQALWNLLDNARGFPKLEQLGLTGAWASLPEIFGKLRLLPHLRELELADPERLVLRRGTDDRMSILEARFDAALAALLRDLPSDTLTSLVVDDVPEDQLDALRTASTAQGRLTFVDLVPHAPVYDY